MFKRSKKIIASLISLGLGSSCFISAKMSDPAGTVEQQNAMVKYFREKIEKYAEKHENYDLVFRCNVVVDKFDEKNGIGFNSVIKFNDFLKLYKNYDLENELWNCRVGSSVLFDYLESNKIRCAYVHINDFLLPTGKIDNHDVVIYSIIIDGKEKWFVADTMDEVFVAANKKVIRKAINKVQNRSGQLPIFNFSNEEINNNLVKFYNLLNVVSGNTEKRNKFLNMGARHVQSKGMNIQIPENGQCLALDFFNYFSNRSKYGQSMVYSDEKDKVLYPNGNSNTAPLLGYWCKKFSLALPEKLMDSNKKSTEFKFNPFEFKGKFDKKEIYSSQFPNRDGFLEKYNIPNFGEGYIWREKELG